VNITLLFPLLSHTG
jgi:hypothetical protein